MQGENTKKSPFAEIPAAGTDKIAIFDA